MLTRVEFLCIAVLATTVVCSPLVLSAQDGAAAASQASQPMRAARLTSSQGTVTVTDGNNPSAPAQMNLPLVQGVQIATGVDGQAEIEFEDGSVARLTPNSALSLDRLDIAPGQLFVTDLSVLRGLAYFELRSTPEYVYSVNAGGDVVSPVENATVRIDLDEPPASISVMDGTAQVTRAKGAKVDVVAGATFRSELGDASQYSVTQQIAADSWDQWNADMDQQAAQQSSDSTSVRDNFAGAQGYGWSDLDSQGTWYDVPGQGQVWQPYVADGEDFDPYGNGAWAWYPGTGYVWASAYPWGWTPYRCGGWTYYDGFGWAWMPDASCGGYGWGFGGGGFVVNVVRWPRGYRPIRVPVSGPGRLHPVVPVHIIADGGRRWTGPLPTRGPRQIAGVTATPVVQRHLSFAAGGGGTVGASLHRDFPIDRATHAPALGRASAGPTNAYRVGPGSSPRQPQGNAPKQGQSNLPQTIYGSGALSLHAGQGSGSNSGSQNGGQQQTSQRPQQNQPAQAQGFEGQRTRGFQQTAPPQVNPSQRPAFVPQHTEPQHIDQNQQRGNFSAPPQRYSPPPQQQQHYSPPPQQPHYSAPPPPPSPPPAPHVSSSPPSSAPAGHR